MSPTHVILTGASSGLGAEIAALYAARGVNRLSLAGRAVERLAAVAERCRQAAPAEIVVTTRAFDIADRHALIAWIAESDAAAPIDRAVSNAGVLFGAEAPGELESADHIARQIDVNLTAAALFLTECGRAMAARRDGRLVAVSSLAAIQPLADEIGYSASKAGLNACCECLREFLEPFDIGVTLACPGFIRTPMGDGYRAPRPMELTSEAAARAIVDAAEKGRNFTAPPAALAWSARLGRLAPRALRRPFTDRLRFRF